MKERIARAIINGGRNPDFPDIFLKAIAGFLFPVIAAVCLLPVVFPLILYFVS